MPRCNATTLRGTRCKARVFNYRSGKCVFHFRVGGGRGRNSSSYAVSAREAKKYQRRGN